MTTKNNAVPHAEASLKLPRGNPALITYGQGVVTGMTGNPHFPTPLPTLAALSAAIADLQTAETVALTRVKGAAVTRDAKRAVLVSLLKQTRSYVQGIADLNPENGAPIIQSAGLAVKRATVRSPRVFAAKAGAVSGTVRILVPSAGPRSSYDWEYSTDGAKTWVAMPSTIAAKTTLSGLTPGSSVQFRYRTVTKAGVSDWSLPITMPMVK